MRTLTFPLFNDLHCHFREGTATSVIYASQFYCDHVLAMPNLKKPLTDGPMASAYAHTLSIADVNVVPVLYLTQQTHEGTLRRAVELGVTTGKLYPAGVTTGSESGVSELRGMWPVFEAMQSLDMVLSIHPESPRFAILDAERVFFFNHFHDLVNDFPRLRIVFEHVTTRDAVDCLRHCKRKNVAATITAHHLFLTTDDVIGHGFRGRNFCRPVAKAENDRAALCQVVRDRDPRFFLGSDTAPHDRDDKFAEECKAGCFTAPHLPCLIAQAIKQNASHGWLIEFCSKRGAEFYRLPETSRTDRTFELVDRPWFVPGEFRSSHYTYLPFLGDSGWPLGWSFPRWWDDGEFREYQEACQAEGQSKVTRRSGFDLQFIGRTAEEPKQTEVGEHDAGSGAA